MEGCRRTEKLQTFLHILEMAGLANKATDKTVENEMDNYTDKGRINEVR